MQLRHLGYMALNEHDGFLRADARGQPVERHLSRVLLKILKFVQGGERMQVYNAVDTFVIILERYIILDCSQIVAQMLAAGRPRAGKNTSFFSHDHSSFFGGEAFICNFSATSLAISPGSA